MATTIKVPTVFTAVDKMTAVVDGMTKSVKQFTQKSSSYVQRFDQKISGAFNRLNKYAQIGIGVGLAGAFTLAAQANLKYEDSLASVSAITGASGKDLARLERVSMDTAKATYKSGTEVLKAYELIGSAKPELLNNIDALDGVTKSAITLSKASRMDLASSAEALTDVMNQFNIPAERSNEIIDSLAAGAKYGAAQIPQIKDAILGFGATAKAANVNVQESIALIEVLAAKGVKGAESGTKLRNVLTNMSVVKSLPDAALKQLEKFGVNTDLVSDSTVPLMARLQELSKIAADPTAMFKIFGKENQEAAAIILNNLPLYEELTGKLGETGTAYEQAAKNSNTMAFWLEAVKKRFTDSLTATQSNNTALEAAKTIMKLVADNMGTIVTVAGVMLGAFVALKVVVGIINAIEVATKLWTKAQKVLNFVQKMNPIGLTIAAIMLLIGLVAVIIAKYDSWGASLTFLLGPLGFIINLIQSFRRHWDSIAKAFKEGGIVAGLKRIGAVILDALLMPMQQLLGWISKIPGMGNMVAPGLKVIEEMRANLNLDSADPKDPEPVIKDSNSSPFIPSTQQQNFNSQQSILERSGHGQVDINVNDPGNNLRDVQTKSKDYNMPVVGSTQGQR